MDLHYKQEVTVGLLVVAASLILIGGLTYLSGKSIFGGKTVTVDVRINSVAGLVQGDPVHISGVRVGRVAGIQLKDVGDVMLYLDVNRSVRPRLDAKVYVRPLDAFGAMFVDYNPGHSDQYLAPGEQLTGTRELPLTETATAIAGQASKVMTGASDLLTERTADDVRQTMLATQRAMDVVTRLGSGPLVTDATQALHRLSSAAERLDSLLASPDLNRSVAQLDEITDNLNDMVTGLSSATQSLAQIMRKIDSDSGTFGRLVNDTAMYNEVLRLTTSMRQLLDDMRERPYRYFNLKVF
jgi:phospholipid/cholesterol/gamma-HCH transport system substrate-binding protein